MNTVILDENQRPINEKQDPKEYYNQFEITENAITINCIVSQRITAQREKLTTVLLFQNSESGDTIALDREINNLGEECIARGYFSYVGNKPNSHQWISDLKAVGPGLNPTELTALKSDILTQVNRILKVEVPGEQVTSEKKMTDVVYEGDSEQTNVAYVPFLDKTSEVRGNIESKQTPEREIVIKPLFRRQQPQKQEEVVM
jgi:hypothetical protein